ncbi:hypothetical protein JCM11251_000479 [Rhodosporidiobolus azoricus]
MPIRRLLNRLITPNKRTYAQQVDLPPSFRPTSSKKSDMASNNGVTEVAGLPVYPRVNVFGQPLLPAPTGNGPTTGFFRNNFCDASPHDPASHTVAAVVTPTFLDFSKSRGNDLTSLFPSLKQSAPSSFSTSQETTSPPCVWCLCASRWMEAFKAAASHPQGEAIVPRVVLEATHERALRDGRIEMEVLEKFAVGGDGSGNLPGQGQGGAAGSAASGWDVAGGATGEKVGR